jgi:hypothetical protein
LGHIASNRELDKGRTSALTGQEARAKLPETGIGYGVDLERNKSEAALVKSRAEGGCPTGDFARLVDQSPGIGVGSVRHSDICISLRKGNFAPNGLLPDKVSLEHWKFVLGIPYQEVVNVATGETRAV